jgi:spermidine synthase
LLPEVIEAASRFQGNENATGDPRLEIRRVDGRHELLRRSDRYDLVTLEPPPPSAAGVANLYSTEFYRLANSRLTPHGIVAQWLPLPTQSDADTRSLVRSFLDVFPHASLWTTELHEMLLMGSPAPLELDAVTIQKRFEQERVRRSLGEVGVGSPAALLATYVCGRDGLEEYARNALPVTDDRPRIEYGRWTVPGDFPRTFQSLMALRSEPVVENADDRLRVAIADQRITLHRFYAASIAAYEGDRSRWKEAIDAVFQSDPDNAYFQWFQAAGDSSPFDPSGP